MAVAVSQGRIDEIHTQLDGAPQRRERLVVGPAKPLYAADAPGAIADFGNLKVRPA